MAQPSADSRTPNEPPDPRSALFPPPPAQPAAASPWTLGPDADATPRTNPIAAQTSTRLGSPLPVRRTVLHSSEPDGGGSPVDRSAESSQPAPPSPVPGSEQAMPEPVSAEPSPAEPVSAEPVSAEPVLAAPSAPEPEAASASTPESPAMVPSADEDTEPVASHQTTAENHRKHRSRRAARTSAASDAAGALGLDLSRLEPAIPLGPLDGRYRPVVAPLVNYLSEAALNRERIRVEVEWLIQLTDAQIVPGAPVLSEDDKRYVRSLVEHFGSDQIAELAEIERTTVHDVKSVEYFIKRRLADAPGILGPDTALPQAAELVHFACTSEDINNLSYALMIRGAITGVWLPAASALQERLSEFAREQAGQPMLARTHGQPATPTTLGKELAVLAFRLGRQLDRIRGAEYLGKLNGATGTFGAHVAAVPDADWPVISRSFVTHLGLTWNPLTTQIESHDWQAELYSDMARFNRVLHNLTTDMWTYISLGYFAQVRGQGTVGSSTMPHKVNPIRFENAEANLEISSALLDTLAATLVTSRMQRDLTDSTTQRNIGPAVGHSLLAIDNVRRGLAGLDVVPAAMAADLESNWEVLGEPIQSAMRAAGVAGVPGMDEPYERLKELTRGRRVDGPMVREFIAGLGLPPEVAERLSAMSPQTYTGLAEYLVREYLP